MSDYIPCGNSPCVMPAGHPGPCAVSVSTGGTPPWANVSPAPLLVIDQAEIARWREVAAQNKEEIATLRSQVADCLGYIDAVITDRDAYEAEGIRLMAACPHRVDGACLDWQAEVVRLRKEREDYREKRANEAAALADALVASRAELHTVREALRPFIGAAEECERHVEAQNAHVREVQRAAALSRSGDVEGGRALIKRIDSQPRVWDFGRIVLMLGKALPAARVALRAHQEGRGP